MQNDLLRREAFFIYLESAFLGEANATPYEFNLDVDNATMMILFFYTTFVCGADS